MDLQIPLMIIDRRGVSIMSTLFTNRRVTHLKFVDVFEWIRNAGEKCGQRRNYFEVPELFRYVEINARNKCLMVVH